MIFHETSLAGAYIIDLELHQDERGFFARTWCTKEFAAHGLNANLVQCNLSYNTKRGILRGMHYQISPYQEIKLVSCTAGAIYDVIIDLQRASPSFGKWEAFELTAQNQRMLYIPQGFAHGFQTLQDGTRVFYQMSDFYHPECARGIRWNDEFFNIIWPIKEKLISDKDKKWNDFTDE